ncbi:phosphoribosylamine--glycine ligase, partial [Streptomyces sp. AC563]|nr:phosphoribosylamine--glycine ligase [Streptomyces buecherae]
MGTEHIRRWESGALAHAVSDPFGMGPLPWLRGSEHYFDDTGHVVPWYVDHVDAPGASTFPLPRAHDAVPGDADDRLHARWGAYAAARRSGHRGGPRMADDVHRQIKGFASAG